MPFVRKSCVLLPDVVPARNAQSVMKAAKLGVFKLARGWHYFKYVMGAAIPGARSRKPAAVGDERI